MIQPKLNIKLDFTTAHLIAQDLRLSTSHDDGLIELKRQERSEAFSEALQVALRPKGVNL